MQLKSYHSIAASLHPWLQLVKVPLCLPVACSAGFGYILHTPVLTPSCGAVICGVFFLACGAAGCNSLQERAVDSLFVRTRNRPLVTGRLTEREATWCSALLVILGLLTLLFSTEGWQPLLLGIIAVVLYNGVYTPLKQTSAFALFPGGLAGALPPLIGWTAAGGMLADNRAWFLFSLFFLWQIPHFCIILLAHHEDYHAVEQPTLSRLFPKQGLTRITQIWILAFIVVALAFTLDGNQLATGARLTIALMAVILTIFCVSLFFKKKSQNYRVMFLILNGSFFSALLIVAILQLYAAR